MLRLGTPQVSALNAGTGSTENGITVFEVLVQAIVKFYGTGWGAQQREVAEIMHSKYYWLHLAEIRQFSLKAKAGDYNRKDWYKVEGGDMEEWDGKIYGQLSPAILLRWIDRFANESLRSRGDMRIENLAPKSEVVPEEKLITPERWNELLTDFEQKATEWKTSKPDPEELKAERVGRLKAMSGHDTVPQDLRDDVHQRFIELKCQVCAEAIANNWDEAMLPEYRQILANYPEKVEGYLKQIRDAA